MDATQQSHSQRPDRNAAQDSRACETDASTRHPHRERDYGIGYGNSSGYGSERHFTDGHADPLFHLG